LGLSNLDKEATACDDLFDSFLMSAVLALI
jgi:hypothetical protein